MSVLPGCPYLSRLPEESPDKCFISARTKGDISTATKGFFNITVSVTAGLGQTYTHWLWAHYRVKSRFSKLNPD